MLDLILDRWGDLDPAKIERRHFISLRDANANAVRFTNYSVQVGRVLMEHAIDVGWRADNPANGVQQIKGDTDPREAWPPYLIEAYRATAEGRALLLFELCLGTGQRIGDVLKMRWSDIEGGGIHVKHGKTRKKLWVPLTASLQATVDAQERRSVFILTNSRAIGPWSYRGAADAVMKVRRQIGAEKCDIHAPRYAAASELAVLGCDDGTIAAITGHTTRAMAAKYTAETRQKIRALDAQKRRK
ncbi:tyrosine-type recombinase/integrase [Rhodovulum sulfidophilum]|uniref:tyrosine-type recombinase/integrase n=1 Tax=Rhodovulum sulfidophilum TaxID=35806 RepID=UPI001F3F1565|nr:tyrosine-type recombinase/integrase [Rhodovulum sulfidophilum]MCE8440706.1 tyrosine-type recombinase/integrase [Rhodovulum sulfidophilum]MCE8467534.1 tyrosine-type recombinase/integrase [Rhodovulum sulfidophilum]